MLSNIRTARNHISDLRTSLLSPVPEPIGDCLPKLVEAAGLILLIEQGFRTAPNRALLPELLQLKADLAAVAKLIEHGLIFYQGWARLIGSATGGYTSAGGATPLAAPGTVFVRG
jgi:hypothetical protein